MVKTPLANSVRQLKRASSSRFVRRVTSVFSVKMAGVGVGFLAQVLIARMIGEDQYGFHAYVVSWLAILVIPSAFGMDMATLRFFSAYISSKAYGKANGLLRFGRRFTSVSSLLCFAVCLGIIGVLYRTGRIDADEALGFAAGFSAIPFVARMQLNAKALWACGKSTLDAALLYICRPLMIVLLISLAYALLPDQPTAKASLASFSLATLCVVLIGAVRIGSYMRQNDMIDVEPEYEKRLWIKTSIPLMLTMGFQIILNQCSIVMVGSYLSYAEAGYYSVANRLIQFVLFGLAATNMIVAPMLSSAHQDHRMEDLKRSLRNGAVIGFGLTVPMVVFMLVAGHFVLSIFGKGFTQAYPALVILCVGQLIHSCYGCLGYLIAHDR